MIGIYDYTVILTYLSFLSGLTGIYFSLNNNPFIGIICIMISGLFDMFDGKVARLCKRDEEEKKFGVEIDSLADMVAFVTFPVVIGYSMGLNSWYNILSYILLVLAGITRLGFFNISVMDTNKDEPVKTYSGLPVTSTSIILPALWFFSSVSHNVSFKSIYTVLIYLIAFLFVFNAKIPKIKGKAYIFVTVAAIIGILLILFLV